MSRSKRLWGRCPGCLWPPEGGRQRHKFICSRRMSSLLPDVVPHHFGVPPNCGYEVPSRPEVLAYEVSFPLSVYTSQVDRALSLDESDHLRHRIFWRDTVRERPCWFAFCKALVGISICHSPATVKKPRPRRTFTVKCRRRYRTGRSVWRLLVVSAGKGSMYAC